MVRGPWRGVEGRHALVTRQGHIGLQLIVAHCVMRPCTCILEVWATRFRRVSVTSAGVRVGAFPIESQLSAQDSYLTWKTPRVRSRTAALARPPHGDALEGDSRVHHRLLLRLASAAARSGHNFGNLFDAAGSRSLFSTHNDVSGSTLHPRGVIARYISI